MKMNLVIAAVWMLVAESCVAFAASTTGALVGSTGAALFAAGGGAYAARVVIDDTRKVMRRGLTS